MTETPAEVVEAAGPPRRRRHWRRLAVVVAVLLLLFGVPWWTLFAAGAAWPSPVFVTGTLLFAVAVVAMPALMVLGHGRRHLDWAAAGGDALLGAAWVLFVWSVLGQLVRVGLLIAGVDDPVRSRVVAASVTAVAVVLLVWGYAEARRGSRGREIDVAIDRLGGGPGGFRFAGLTHTPHR